MCNSLHFKNVENTSWSFSKFPCTCPYEYTVRINLSKKTFFVLSACLDSVLRSSKHLVLRPLVLNVHARHILSTHSPQMYRSPIIDGACKCKSTVPPVQAPALSPATAGGPEATTTTVPPIYPPRLASPPTATDQVSYVEIRVCVHAEIKVQTYASHPPLPTWNGIHWCTSIAALRFNLPMCIFRSGRDDCDCLHITACDAHALLEPKIIPSKLDQSSLCSRHPTVSRAGLQVQPHHHPQRGGVRRLPRRGEP